MSNQLTPMQEAIEQITKEETEQLKEIIEKSALKYAEENQYDLEYYDEGGYKGIEVKSFAEKLVDFFNKHKKQ